MKALILTIAIFSFSFNSANFENSSAANMSTLINIEQLFETWHVTDAYTLNGRIKKDAMTEVRSTRFIFEKDNTFRLIDSNKKNKEDIGEWKLKRNNSIEVKLYDTKINFKIKKLNENVLKLVSYGKKMKKVITFSSENL